MATSIRAAQAELIASGFLSDIGTSRDEMVPVNALTELIKLAALIVTEAQSNLQKGGHVSSGDLSDSIKVLNPRSEAGIIMVEIEALFYYQYLNKGVRGTKSGAGEYKFKSDMPSQDMVDSISDWIKKAGLSSTNVVKKHAQGNVESKNASISEFDKAFAVARGIKQHGIKPSGFFDKAVKIAQGYAKDKLGKALIIDVTNALPKTWNNGNNNKK